jgi:hypothetical protein
MKVLTDLDFASYLDYARGRDKIASFLTYKLVFGLHVFENFSSKRKVLH